MQVPEIGKQNLPRSKPSAHDGKFPRRSLPDTMGLQPQLQDFLLLYVQAETETCHFCTKGGGVAEGFKLKKIPA